MITAKLCLKLPDRFLCIRASYIWIFVRQLPACNSFGMDELISFLIFGLNLTQASVFIWISFAYLVHHAEAGYLLLVTSYWLLIHLLVTDSVYWLLIHLLITDSVYWLLIHLLVTDSIYWLLIWFTGYWFGYYVLIRLLVTDSGYL